MSAFVVEDRTISKITAWIARQPGQEYWRERFASFVECATNDTTFFQKLGEAMREMNCESVKQRYPNSFADMIPQEEFHIEELWPTEMEVFKAFACLLYQSCEGDVGQSLLYGELRKLQLRCATEIIAALPEYESAGRWE